MSTDGNSARRHEPGIARRTANPSYSHRLTPTQRQDEVLLRLPEPQTGLAIFPLRYAVMPKRFDQSNFEGMQFDEYLEQDGFHVGLRGLRPHTWLYVLYTENGKHHTRQYLLTKDAQFRLVADDGLPCEASRDTVGGDPEIPTLDRIQAPQPFATAPLPTQERAIGPTCWMLTCDTSLTPEMLDRLARDEGGLRSRTATELRIEGGPDQPNVFGMSLLEQVPDFVADEAGRIAAREWSESRPDTFEGGLIRQLCERRRNAPWRRYPPLCVAMHDTVGVMSEFGHLTGTQIQQLTEWLDTEQVARKVMVSEWIDELGRQRARAVELDRFNNDAIGSAIPAGVGGGAANAARDRAYQAGVQAREERLSFARNKERREFMRTYKQRRQELVDAIGVPAAAANAMYQTLHERHDATLDLYDERDAGNFICLRRAVTYSLSVLACDPQGRQTLEEMLPPEGPTGQMRRAIMGYPLFESLIAQATGPNTQAGAVAVSIQANRVLDAAAQVPPDDASRYLGMVTAALVANGKLSSPEALERSLYYRALQLMDGELVEHEMVKRADAGKWLLMRNGGDPVNGFRPTTVAAHGNELIRLYRSEPVQAQLKEIDQAASAVRREVHFWQGIKFGFGAFGLYMGTRNLSEVMRNFGQADGMLLVNSLDLGTGLLVAGSGTAALGEAGHQWRQGVEASQGRPNVAGAAERTAQRFGNFAVGLLALSAAAVFVKELFVLAPAAETRGASAGHMAGATLQMASATVGGLHLIGRLENQRRFTNITRHITSGIAAGANSRGAVGAAARLAAAGTRLGAGPVGWTLLALEGTYVAVKAWNERNADEAKVTTWIARSIWGTGERPRLWFSPEELTMFSELEEMKGFYMFFQVPHVESDKDVLAGLAKVTPPGMIYNVLRNGTASPASRTVTVAFPGWQPQVSRFEIVQHREFKVTGERARYDDAEMVTVRNGVGYVSFLVDNWGGDIEVKYWPNAFAQPDVVLTAEDT